VLVHSAGTMKKVRTSHICHYSDVFMILQFMATSESNSIQKRNWGIHEKNFVIHLFITWVIFAIQTSEARV